MFRKLLGPGNSTRVFLLVAAVSAVVALQGWKARIPNFDVLTTIYAAKDFVSAWQVPDRGVLTSFSSFTPPGAAWLMIPGVVVFKDPRLFEYLGSIGLYLGTLCGIFFLTRRYLGARCALLAVVLYAFSGLGLLASSSLWQRYPIQCFTVWFALAIAGWVEEDQPAFLGGALLIWAAGMYVFMEMAPAILAVPVIWLLYRPTVRVLPVMAAAILAAAIWYPYVRFEQRHHFVDVRSQVLRERVDRGPFYESWCDTAVAPVGWQRTIPASPGPASPLLSARRWVRERAGLMVGELLMANFAGSSSIPGAPYVLFLLTLSSGLVLAAGSRSTSPNGVRTAAEWSHRVTCLSVGLALLALILNEGLLARYLSANGILAASSIATIRTLQAILLILAAALYLFRNRLGVAIRRAICVWSAVGDTSGGGALTVTLAVSWFALLLLSDFERRFGWIWPLEVILLAASVTYLPLRLGAPRWVRRLGPSTLIVFVLANSVLLSRVDDWIRHGWSGRDAIEIELTDHLAAMVQSAGVREASIGYEIDIWQFMALDNNVDSRYKAGADLDLLLKQRHGITNRDRCAEGFSVADQYRVVQTTPRDASPAGRNRIASWRDASFEMEERVGVYEIYRRSPVDDDQDASRFHRAEDRMASTIHGRVAQ